jgi:uncharacterized protein YbaR (Trm112 family)
MGLGPAILSHRSTTAGGRTGQKVTGKNGGTGKTDHRKNAPWRYNKRVMIPQDLLDMLVCPVCKKPVVLVNNNTSLKCGECHRVYPIQDDIPIMLVDAAKIEAS